MNGRDGQACFNVSIFLTFKWRLIEHGPAEKDRECPYRLKSGDYSPESKLRFAPVRLRLNDIPDPTFLPESGVGIGAEFRSSRRGKYSVEDAIVIVSGFLQLS